MNASQSPATRANELLSAMSLSDKINMVTGKGESAQGAEPAYTPSSSDSSSQLENGLQMDGTNVADNNAGVASSTPANPALCIPALEMADSIAGVGDWEPAATAFPDSITLASSWDPSLGLDYGETIGKEAFDKGVNVLLGPGMDIARNPLNGRNFEYAGEDPFLAGTMVSGVVQGVQSQHVIATAKHYALNDQETNRMTDSSDASVRTMQEIDLPAFDMAVKAGVGSVMCSYNRINGVYACQDPYTLTDVLDGQFGFGGFVMSDWGATHSTVQSADAGMDQENNLEPGSYYGSALETAVQDGQVSMATLNEMVYRILYSMFRIGLFDHVPTEGPAALATPATSPADLDMATKVAESGAVLLRNEAGVLPLDGPEKRIAVIGPAAGPHGAELCEQGWGSGHTPIPPQPVVVSPLTALQARAAQAGDVVTYADGTQTKDAVAAATAADYAVVFICDAESEGVDRPNINADFGLCELVTCAYSPIDQNALVEAVAAANPHTIVVVQAGGPVAMPWINQVQGVVDTFYPGQTDGLSIAPILFGNVDPSGHLPYTFPVSTSEDPLQTSAEYPGVTEAGDSIGPHSSYSEGLLVGYRWYDEKGITPLFPFGYGLSYTSFRFSRLKVTASRDDGATVRFRLTNTGSRYGADVAQVYVGMPASTGEPPRQLKGFQKVWLEPGRSKTVSIRLDAASFAHWDDSASTWVITPGSYDIYVGDSSALANLPLQAALDRDAATLSPGAY